MSIFFITGGAGFIGSHVADVALQRGHEVVVVDDFSTGCADNLQAARQSHRFSLIEADVATLDWAQMLRPRDVIIHLAAVVGVKKVCQSALATARNNHAPLEPLLEALRRQKSRLLYASTSEVYGDSPPEGSSEEDLLHVHSHLGGRSAYTLSKLYGEMLTLAYADTYGLSATVLRLFNTIGPRQRGEYGMVVPNFVRQGLGGLPITVYGDGTQTRSFCDVRDTAHAICLLAEMPECAQGILNLGNHQEVTVAVLAEFVRSATGGRSVVEYLPFPPERAGCTDIRTRRPDLRRLHATLGWQPGIDWQEAVRHIIHTQTQAHAERPDH